MYQTPLVLRNTVFACFLRIIEAKNAAIIKRFNFSVENAGEAKNALGVTSELIRFHALQTRSLEVCVGELNQWRLRSVELKTFSGDFFGIRRMIPALTWSSKDVLALHCLAWFIESIGSRASVSTYSSRGAFNDPT